MATRVPPEEGEREGRGAASRRAEEEAGAEPTPVPEPRAGRAVGAAARRGGTARPHPGDGSAPLDEE